MIGMLVHLFVILPAVDKILKLENYSKATRIAMVCVFLSAIAAGSAYYEHMNEPPNLYRIVDAKRGTTASEMKKQYRAMAVKLHPDKVPDAQKAEAEKEFLRLKDAFEVLSNDRLRELYDRFGHTVLRKNSGDSSSAEFSGLIDLAVFYILWFLLVFFIVSGKSSLAGRTWSYAGLAALFLLDAQTKYADLDFLSTLFPYNTPYEKIAFLRACFPSFMSGCRVISQATFVDYEAADRAALAQTLENTRAILSHVMQILHNQVGGHLALSTACFLSERAACVRRSRVRFLRSNLHSRACLSTFLFVCLLFALVRIHLDEPLRVCLRICVCEMFAVRGGAGWGDLGLPACRKPAASTRLRRRRPWTWPRTNACSARR